MATLLILEPIFEADFENCSYGFRPGRSAHQALKEIQTHLKGGFQAVYDADLKGCLCQPELAHFDTLIWPTPGCPHEGAADPGARDRIWPERSPATRLARRV